jgi:hypothetical protein
MEKECDDKIYEINQEEKRERRAKVLESMKTRFKKIAKKKFTTCFIFAISEFEKVWGQELWGHGLPEDQLTDKQKANRERWGQVRRDILDKGNSQLRGFESEIDVHDLEFKGYSMTFVVKEGDKNGSN